MPQTRLEVYLIQSKWFGAQCDSLNRHLSTTSLPGHILGHPEYSCLKWLFAMGTISDHTIPANPPITMIFISKHGVLLDEFYTSSITLGVK